MSTPEELINQIIDNALTTAEDFTDKVESAADSLIAVTGAAWFPPPNQLSGFAVTAVEPEIPTVADQVLTFEVWLEKLIAMLSEELDGFFAKYYPLEDDSFDEAQAWLINTISNGGTGINEAIEAQVWQRARDRILMDARRVENQISTGYAAKNYTMPSGSMLGKLDEARFAQIGETGVQATSIASKQLEIEIETIKFAIGKSIDSRQMAMAAAVDYIKAVASLPASALGIAELGSDAKAKMMSAAADFYRARLNKDELILKSQLSDIDSSVDVWKMQKTNATDAYRVNATALSAAADAFARSASAALSSLNSIVSSATNSFS